MINITIVETHEWMNEYVFFFGVNFLQGKKKMKNVNYQKCHNVNYRFYSVLWCYGLWGLDEAAPFHRFRVRQLSKI